MRPAVTGAHTGPAVVAVANRLPVRHGGDGWELSPGGLVTALRPVMASHEGAWVGWDGGTKGTPPTLPGVDIRLLPIRLSAAQLRDYYNGFANATLWPLLHDAIEKPRFERAWWQSYRQVNAAFADRALAALGERPDALVLSEFTGAAAELRDAVPCNPFDVEGLSQRIEHALRLPAATRRGALSAMARHVRGHDVHRWVAGQLADIAARGAAR